MWMARFAVAITLLQNVSMPVVLEAQNAHKRVLVLYATRRDSSFTNIGERQLPRLIDQGVSGDLDYYSEFIDLARFSDADYREAFRDFLAEKFQRVTFDLVIALQDASVEFMTAYGHELFGETPWVFLSNSEPLPNLPNATGVLHRRDFASTVTLMRQLQPNVKQLFVVTGRAAADKQFEAEVRQQLPGVNAGLTVTYLSGLPTPALEQRLATLPAGSAIYYVLVAEDGDGNRYQPLEYIDRIAAVANAPIYCWVDSAMDHGTVGGSLYSQQGAIDIVASVALRVLRGESPADIPVASLSLNTAQVDWRQVERWGISEGRIPQGTVIRFRDPGIWDRYRGYIMIASGLLVLQTMLIAGLLIQRRRRHLAEVHLLQSQYELKRSYDRIRDLGGRLLQAQETERSRIARELHDDICQRMLLLTIELETLDRANRHAIPSAAALASARDIAKSLHELSHQLHPARLRMIGLVAAIDALCAEMPQGRLPVTFTHRFVPPELPPDVTLCLFRVVQEALQNALKYSAATSMTVSLTGAADALRLEIVDNGVGFEVEAVWGEGVGLVSMVERVESVGGTLAITSRPGETRVAAAIPVPALAATEDGASEQSPHVSIH